MKTITNPPVFWKQGRLSAAEMRKLRLLCGFTQAELGRLLAISRQTVVNWEKGVRRAKWATEILLRKLAAEAADDNSFTLAIAQRTQRERP